MNEFTMTHEEAGTIINLVTGDKYYSPIRLVDNILNNPFAIVRWWSALVLLESQAMGYDNPDIILDNEGALLESVAGTTMQTTMSELVGAAHEQAGEMYYCGNCEQTYFSQAGFDNHIGETTWNGRTEPFCIYEDDEAYDNWKDVQF